MLRLEVGKLEVGSRKFKSDQWAVFNKTVGSVEMTFWTVFLKLVFKSTFQLHLVTSTIGLVRRGGRRQWSVCQWSVGGVQEPV
ncbi:hypothetical protein [Aquiflexum sp.]|uniref:hypothetical protein n=1 Tax=Aquiflexum sp. TaxID=1872584 RepID=UPI0035945AA1